MKKKELDYIKATHEQILGGTYDPQKLTNSILLISKEHDVAFMNVKTKKRILAGFVQYQYPILIKEMTKKFGAELLTQEEIAEGKDPINTRSTDLNFADKEEVKMEKPTTTKKKRVYKRKPTKPKANPQK